MTQLEKPTSLKKLTVLNTVLIQRCLHKIHSKLKPVLSNITKDERKALHNLRKDNSHIVLTAGKGVASVIIDIGMYIEKCMVLLNYEEVYCESRDQTTSINSKVVQQLLDLKNSIEPKFKDQYNKLYPLGDNSYPSIFYCLPKIQKPTSHLYL